MSDILKQDMERFARQQPASTAAKQAAQQVNDLDGILQIF